MLSCLSPDSTKAALHQALFAPWRPRRDPSVAIPQDCPCCGFFSVHCQVLGKQPSQQPGKEHIHSPTSTPCICLACQPFQLLKNSPSWNSSITWDDFCPRFSKAAASCQGYSHHAMPFKTHSSLASTVRLELFLSAIIKGNTVNGLSSCWVLLEAKKLSERGCNFELPTHRPLPMGFCKNSDVLRHLLALL